MSVNLSVSLTQDDNSLKWGELPSQKVTCANNNFASTLLELLEEQYGLVRKPTGECTLSLEKTYRLIEEMLPFLQRELRMDWITFRQKLHGILLRGPVQIQDIPEDFDEKLQEALKFFERRYCREHQIQSNHQTQEPMTQENLAPYDLSGLTTLLQNERFMYVYQNRPTIQQIEKQLKTNPTAWRQYVKNTLNPKLTDCTIQHNKEAAVWEVHPIED